MSNLSLKTVCIVSVCMCACVFVCACVARLCRMSIAPCLAACWKSNHTADSYSASAAPPLKPSLSQEFILTLAGDDPAYAGKSSTAQTAPAAKRTSSSYTLLICEPGLRSDEEWLRVSSLEQKEKSDGSERKRRETCSGGLTSIAVFLISIWEGFPQRENVYY